MKRFSKIVSIVLSLSLILGVLAVSPFSVAAQSTVPIKAPGAHDYADDIVGFWDTCYGAPASDLPTWNSTTKGITVPLNPTEYVGATLAGGYSISGGNNSAVVVSASVTPGSVDATSKIVFRYSSFGHPGAAPTNMYMLAIGASSVSIEKYWLSGSNWDSTLETVASAPYTRNSVSPENITIMSGHGKVSVWINGTLYIDEVIINTISFIPTFGYWYKGDGMVISGVSIFDYSVAPVAVPTALADNTDYADNITGFTGTYHAPGNTTYQPVWNSTTKGFSSEPVSNNGAVVANGCSLTPDKTALISLDISVPQTGMYNPSAVIIFRVTSYADYYGLYLTASGNAILLHNLNNNNDLYLAEFQYTPAVSNHVVISSSPSRVSIWIDNTQYVFDYGYDFSQYYPAFGFASDGVGTVANLSITNRAVDLALNQTAPQKTAGNADYAEYITGFGASMYGTSAADMNALLPWNSTTKGFTTSGSISTNGATLASYPTLDASETTVLETSISASTFARADIIFRAQYNYRYYALYVQPTAVSLYKYASGGGDDILVAVSTVAYSYSSNDRIVIKSGDNKVSVWINGQQYFRDVAIETDAYYPTFGLNTYSATDLALTNTSLYLTRSDPALNQSAPTAIEGNINYAEDITGFSKAAWSDDNDASTLPSNYVSLGEKSFSQHNHFAYGGYLAQGYAIDGTNPCLLESDIYTSNVSGRVDVIFRALTYGNYYALYIYDSSVRLYHWLPGSETEVAVSYIPFSRPVSGNSHVVILSTQSTVSVWIDGQQYFRDVAISATNFASVIGINTNGMTDNSDTVSFSNLGLYLNIPDYDLTYAPTSDVYMLKNGVYYGIAPGTTVSTFRSNVNTSSSVYTYQILKNSSVVTSGNMSTGMQVQVLINGEPIAGVYEVAVRCDLDGDGLVLASDLTCLINHLIGSEELTGAKLFAADPYDSETLPDITTLVWMKKAIAGKTSYADPQHTSTYSENSFKIGAYIDGYHLDNSTNVFTALKNANVNLVVPTNWPSSKTTSEYAQVLDTAENVGIDYLVDLGAASGQNALDLRGGAISQLTAAYKNKAHAYGYHLADEPTIGQFSSINLVNDLIRKYDPSAAVFSCLYPSYGQYKWSGSTTSFATYINRFISIAKPQILGNDYYIYTESSTPDLNVYDIWRDMGYLRKNSIENNVPYWHVFQGITDYDYATTTGMTLAKYSVQMKSALAYGCKAAIYFTGVETFCDSNGNLSDLYSDLAGLNTQVQRIGNLIYNATSTEIYHPRLDSQYTSSYYLSDVSESALISSFNTSGSRNRNIICSVFEDSSNYYVLFVNKSVDSSANYYVSLKTARDIAEFNVADNTIGAANSSSTLSGTVGAGDISVYVLSK